MQQAEDNIDKNGEITMTEDLKEGVLRGIYNIKRRQEVFSRIEHIEEFKDK
ncbi:MAG: hypothetical protein HYW77_00155 [Parcubacteria group bacterium]|nr:hypothetical protein [Parcubacteria group bacterium]